MKRRDLCLVLLGLSLFLHSCSADEPLEKMALLDGKVSLLVPTAFKPMGEEMLQAKYPSANRPSIVFTDDMGAVNVVLNHTANRLPITDLREARPQIEQVFRISYPDAVWHRNEVSSINGRDFIVFDLHTPTIDTTVRNLMLATSLDGRMLLISVNMTTELEPRWLPVAHRIVESVEIDE